MGKKGVSLKKLFTGKEEGAEEKDLKDDVEVAEFGEKQPQAIELLRKIQEQLMFLERKVDTLLAQGGGAGRPRFGGGGGGRDRGFGGGGGRDRGGFGGGGDRGFRPRHDRGDRSGGGGFRGGRSGGHGRDRGFGGGGGRREWQGGGGGNRSERPEGGDRQPSNWSDQPKNF